MNLRMMLLKFFEQYPDFWNYYNRTNGEIREQDARQFIATYFEYASKQSIVADWLQLKDCNDSMRYQHSVIAFFIGSMIQKEMDENLYIRSEELIDGKYIHYSFSYLWFLTCLGHDIGYQVERYSENNIYNIVKEYENVFHKKNGFFSTRNVYSCLPTSLKIVPSRGRGRNNIRKGEYNFLDMECWRNQVCATKCYDKNIVYSNYTAISRRWYSLETQDKYFEMRFFEDGLIDHGITGADYLHEKLLDNYKRAAENRVSGTYKNFKDENGKHFSIEQWRIFQYICDCIAAHNIHSSGAEIDRKMQYKKYGLRYLWAENFRKISYKEDPLLFILCIADTLEPTKRFENNDQALDKIIIDYKKECNTLYVHVDYDLGTKKQREHYIKGLQSLVDWVDINVQLF